MFEYQTAISELTGPAGVERRRSTRARAPSPRPATWRSSRPSATRLVASRGLHPHSRAALATHAAGYGMEVVEVPLDGDGATDLEALAAAVDDDTAAVFVQQPNFLGTVEELGALAEAGKPTGALFVVRRRSAAARASSSRPASSAPTSAWARASRSATGSTSAGRRSASSPPPSASCARCPAGSRARRATPTAGAASCSPSRRASSTSGARRPPTTSAPRRRSTRSPA